MSQFVQACGADLEILEFSHEDDILSTSSNRANVEIDFLLKNVIQRFHMDLCEGTAAENIEKCITQHSTDIIVMLVCHYVPTQMNQRKRNT